MLRRWWSQGLRVPPKEGPGRFWIFINVHNEAKAGMAQLWLLVTISSVSKSKPFFISSVSKVLMASTKAPSFEIENQTSDVPHLSLGGLNFPLNSFLLTSLLPISTRLHRSDWGRSQEAAGGAVLVGWGADRLLPHQKSHRWSDLKPLPLEVTWVWQDVRHSTF